MNDRKTSSNKANHNLAVVAFLLACANTTSAYAQGVMLSEPEPDSTLPPEVVPVNPNSMPQNPAAFNGAANNMQMSAQNGMPQNSMPQNSMYGSAPQVAPIARNLAAQQMPMQGAGMQNAPQPGLGQSQWINPAQPMANNQMQPMAGYVNYQQPRRSMVNGATVANTVNALTRLAGPALMLGALTSRRPSSAYGLGMMGLGFGGFRF